MFKKKKVTKTDKVIINDETLKAEIVGFHKGALSALVQERDQLQKSLELVEQAIGMHVNALDELGVKLDESS